MGDSDDQDGFDLDLNDWGNLLDGEKEEPAAHEPVQDQPAKDQPAKDQPAKERSPEEEAPPLGVREQIRLCVLARI